jgi:signal peptide peptidase SppA
MTPSRLWQIDQRFLAAYEARLARKAGLDPETLDDVFTEYVADALGVDSKPLTMTNDGIAVVSVIGPLYKGKSPFVSNYKSIGEALSAIEQMEQLPPVVLRIDSPGGMVAGLDPVLEQIDRLSEKTLVVASINGMGASAAYRIASKAGTIFASRDSEVGSIGTYWQLLDYSKAFQKAGIRSVLLTTGKYKGVGAVGEKLTAEQVAFLQESVDQSNSQFLEDVRRGRGMTDTNLDEVSDGRWWQAGDAEQLNLIDGVASFESVLAMIRSQFLTGEPEMAKPKLQPEQAVEAEETAAVAAVATPAAGPVAEVAEPELDENEEVEPASEDELTGDAEIVEAAGPGLAEYMAAFGDAEGARMFRDGVAFDQAQQQSLQELRGTVQDLRAELAQLREQAQLLASVSPDEAEGVNIASQPQRSSWADACRGKRN